MVVYSLCLRFMMFSLMMLFSATSLAEKTTLSPLTKPVMNNSNISSPGNAIAGGQTYPKDAPQWLALLKNWDTDGVCTAEFITPSYVLTAKHCILSKDQQNFVYDTSLITVKYGSNRNNQYVAVDKIILWDGDTPDKDLVLVKLATPYPNVIAAPLYHGYQYSYNQPAVVMGYGRFGGNKPNPQRILNWATTFISFTHITDFFKGKGIAVLANPRGPVPAGYPPIGSVMRGDSGGPLLITPNKNDDISSYGKIIAITSGGNGNNDIYSLIDNTALQWIGNRVSAIISSPADGRVFTRNSKEIIVTGYGASPQSVTLADPDKQSVANCPSIVEVSLNSWQCKLDISQLTEEKKAGYYTINAQRSDGSADSVHIQIKPDGANLEITFPDPLGSSYTYKTQATNPGIYSITGKGTAGDTLNAILQPAATTAQINNPCVDDQGQPQTTITVSSQGTWVCNIKSETPDQDENIKAYLFDIFVSRVNSDSNDNGVRKDRGNIKTVASIFYQVSYDLKPVTIDELPEVIRNYPEDVLNFSGTGEPGAFVEVYTSPDSIWDNGIIKIGTDGRWKTSDLDFDWLTPNATLHADMYISLDNYANRRPDSAASKLLNFADTKIAFLNPPQLGASQGYNTVSKNIFNGDDYLIKMLVKGYPYTDNKIESGDDHFNYLLYIEPLQQQLDETKMLCSRWKSNGGDEWQCEHKENFPYPAGDYTLEFDVVQENTVIREMKENISLVDVGFIFPTSVSRIADADISFAADASAGNGLTIKGNFSSQYSANTDVTLTYVEVDDNDKQIGPPQNCSNAVQKSNDTWTCSGVFIKNTGLYRFVVTMTNKLNNTQQNAKTWLRVIDGTQINYPKNNAVITNEAVTPEGNSTPNSQIKCEVNQPQSFLQKIFSLETYSDTVTTSPNGRWTCKAIITDKEGPYKVTATESINGKEIDSSNVNFSKKEDDYRDDDEEPKSPGHSGDGFPGGGSIGIGPLGGLLGLGGLGGAGGCHIGDLLKVGRCHSPDKGSKCPSTYRYDSKTNSCQGDVVEGSCPSGYVYDNAAGKCAGPVAEGPAFQILSPRNKVSWDCLNNCTISGQIPAGDSAVITIVDTSSGEKIDNPVMSVIPDSNYPTLWQARGVNLIPGATLDIIATRMHNGKSIPGVESVQAVEITTPSIASELYFSVARPVANEIITDGTNYTISGQAQTGSNVNVLLNGQPYCWTNSVDDKWSCVLHTLQNGNYTLSATNYSKNGSVLDAPVIRPFLVERHDQIPFTIEHPGNSEVISKGDNYVISGQAETGSIVKLSGDINCTTTSFSNSWSCGPYNLLDKEYHITASEYDSRNNSLNSEIKRYFLVANHDEKPFTVDHPEENETIDKGDGYFISGQAGTGSTVKLSGDIDCTTTSVADSWTCGPYNLLDKEYHITASEYDSRDNNLTSEVKRSFSVVSSGEIPLTIDNPEENETIDKGDNYVISGQAVIGSIVELSGDIDCTTTSFTGSWSCGPYNLSGKSYSITANNYDFNNNSLSPSIYRHFFVKNDLHVSKIDKVDEKSYCYPKEGVNNRGTYYICNTRVRLTDESGAPVANQYTEFNATGNHFLDGSQSPMFSDNNGELEIRTKSITKMDSTPYGTLTITASNIHKNISLPY